MLHSYYSNFSTNYLGHEYDVVLQNKAFRSQKQLVVSAKEMMTKATHMTTSKIEKKQATMYMYLSSLLL